MENGLSTPRRYTLLSFRRGPRLRLAVLIVRIFATSARYAGASTPWPFQPLPWSLIVCRLSLDMLERRGFSAVARSVPFTRSDTPAGGVFRQPSGLVSE